MKFYDGSGMRTSTSKSGCIGSVLEKHCTGKCSIDGSRWPISSTRSYGGGGTATGPLKTQWVFVSHYGRTKGEPYGNREKFIQSACVIRAGVTPFGFHAFRRYFASILADNEKVSLKQIQDLLRHAKPGTTERYILRLSSDLKTAVDMVAGGLEEQFTHGFTHDKKRG